MIRLACPALIGLAVLLAACGSDAPTRPATTPPDFEVAFVVDPLTGYPLVSPSSQRLAVREAYGALRRGAAPSSVADRAHALLEEDPGYHPARVLLSQVDYVEARYAEAAARLQPIVDELPDFVAAALLHARALERLGEIVASYAAYRDLADIQTLAAERAAALEERAIDIVHRRLEDALRRGRVEDAEEILARLESWRPDEPATLEARLQVMRAAEDEEGELQILRRLVARDGRVTLEGSTSEGSTSQDSTSQDPTSQDSTWQDSTWRPAVSETSRWERYLDLAELELEIGDLRQGIAVLETVDSDALSPAERDRFLSVRDRGRFLRRLDLLPPKVAERSQAAELDRAELASLFYWLFPSVRYAPLDEPPIASDIVDHPERREILLVVDQSLMEVDQTVHRFAPERPASRLDTLRGVLAYLAAQEPLAACLEGVDGRSEQVLRQTRPWICARAARCGLIEDPASCLPSAAVSGAEALELVRRGLLQLGDPETGPVRP